MIKKKQRALKVERDKFQPVECGGCMTQAINDKMKFIEGKKGIRGRDDAWS